MLKAAFLLTSLRQRTRRLLVFLKRLQAQRKGSIEEISVRRHGQPSNKTSPRERDSVDGAQNANENEPKLLKIPIGTLSARKQKTSILDIAIGVEKTVCSTENLTDADLFALRHLTTALNLLFHSSPIRASKAALCFLGKLHGKPEVLSLLTPHAWQLLWALEKSDIPTYRSKLIGDIMVSAGVELMEEQEIKYIGGLFWHEKRDYAMQRWKTFVEKGNPSFAFWNLGIRMFALEKGPKEAEDAVQDMTKALGRTTAKTWIPVIMSYNHIYQSEKAWLAYEKMQQTARENNEEVKPAQLDDLCMSFLDSGQPAMGLEIYKSMVFSGRKAIERMDTEVYWNLNPAIISAQAQSRDPEELNYLSTDALKNLPPMVADKYFYGSWMKNLMRMGRTDLACFLVVDVMVQNGHAPDSIHINWLIQGFIKERNIKMAEKLGKEMIHERLRLISERQRRKCRDPSRPSKNDTPGPIAPATIQTFSLLIQHAARAQNMSRVVALCGSMFACKLSPDSYILNHLLYAYLRSNDLPNLKRTFTTMLEAQHVKPDLETFHILWLASYKRLTKNNRKAPVSLFFPPRHLFKIMTTHLPVSEKPNKQLRSVWHMLIKTFMLTRDLAGVLVALHVGKRLWNIDIDERIYREIIFGVLKSRRYNKNKKEKEKEKEKESGEDDDDRRVTPHYIGRAILEMRAFEKTLWDKNTARKGSQMEKDVRWRKSLRSLTTLLRAEMSGSVGDVEGLWRAEDEMVGGVVEGERILVGGWGAGGGR